MLGYLAGIPGRLKTISDRLSATWSAKLDTLHDSRLTATRASNLDRLDTTISSRAEAATALSSSTWTTARAGYLDKLNLTGAIASIKSVQYGSVTISYNAASATATISSVTTSKAILINLGVNAFTPGVGDIGAASSHVGITLTNSTTVTGYHKADSSNGASVQCYFCVLEFY